MGLAALKTWPRGSREGKSGPGCSRHMSKVNLPSSLLQWCALHHCDVDYVGLIHVSATIHTCKIHEYRYTFSTTDTGLHENVSAH